MFHITETQLKNIKKNSILPDSYFVSKYHFSPYRACNHGCVYCDGRSEKYYVPGDFERNIEARINTPELLNTFLHKTREKGIISISSGVSDAYQPPEAKLKIMPDIAKVIIKHKYPAMVLTKSSLILRDIDLWKEVNSLSSFTLLVSLTSLDENLIKKFEPNASLVSERLEIIKQFKEAGIKVGVLAMPFLPYITDTKNNINSLLTKMKQLSVDVVFPGILTLRPGRQKNFFLNHLATISPELISKYNHLYSENRISGSPKKEYIHSVMKIYSNLSTKFKIPEQMPHYMYHNQFQKYDELYILLSHMIPLYRNKGVNVAPLIDAFKKYEIWLIKQKKILNRNKKNGNHLDELLINSFYLNDFNQILQNDKLFYFLKPIILENKCFNENTM